MPKKDQTNDPTAGTTSTAPSDAGTPANSSLSQAIIDAWAATAKPGEFHAFLNPLVGKWKIAIVNNLDGMQGVAGDAGDESGSVTFTWRLGNRWLEQDFSSTFMGTQYDGLGYLGYDTGTSKYAYTWMDTAGTMVVFLHGTSDETGKIFWLGGTYLDPLTNQMKVQRQVITLKSDDLCSWAIYNVLPDGTEIKVTEIAYTRVKSHKNK